MGLKADTHPSPPGVPVTPSFAIGNRGSWGVWVALRPCWATLKAMLREGVSTRSLKVFLRSAFLRQGCSSVVRLPVIQGMLDEAA